MRVDRMMGMAHLQAMNALDLLLERFIHELVLLDEGEALERRTCYLDVVEGSATALYHI